MDYLYYQPSGNLYRMWRRTKYNFILFLIENTQVYSSDGWHSESKETKIGGYISEEECKDAIIQREKSLLV